MIHMQMEPHTMMRLDAEERAVCVRQTENLEVSEQGFQAQSCKLGLRWIRFLSMGFLSMGLDMVDRILALFTVHIHLMCGATLTPREIKTLGC